MFFERNPHEQMPKILREFFRHRFFFVLVIFSVTHDFGNGEFSYSSFFGDNLPVSLPVKPARTKYFTPMHKVLMTQRGYIQFLRWELPVPEIEEFTFCLWVKSINLTYPHSIFSYSKEEKDRHVRAWISSYGKSIHLEINNVEIFAHPTDIKEHVWYHVCQSWSSVDARYALWINAQKQVDGYATEMAGHIIPSNGDIVLGQEYTDFDKGLEDGIEGAVVGFNLVLSSAFDPAESPFDKNKLEDLKFPVKARPIDYEAKLPRDIFGIRIYPRNALSFEIPSTRFGNHEINSPRPSNYFQDILQAINPEELREESRKKRQRSFFDDYTTNYWQNLLPEQPLGQRLIDVSFEHCEQGRGSPNIGDKLMLISWTRTPVRIFGGAIVKNVKSECGSFPEKIPGENS